MSDYSAGDVLFIVLILGVIHGIMLMVGVLRRRRAARDASDPPPANQA